MYDNQCIINIFSRKQCQGQKAKNTEKYFWNLKSVKSCACPQALQVLRTMPLQIF